MTEMTLGRSRQLALGILLVSILGACTLAPGAATPAPTPDPTSTAEPTPEPTAEPTEQVDPTDAPDNGITEDEAIELARASFTDDPDSAPFRVALAGEFGEVYVALVDRRSVPEQPLPDDVAADQEVWGVQFEVTLEICGPEGVECEERPGIRTVFLNYDSGEWLKTSDYGPAPGMPLPTVYEG